MSTEPEIVMTLRVAQAIVSLAAGTDTGATTSRYAKAAAACARRMTDEADVIAAAWAIVHKADGDE